MRDLAFGVTVTTIGPVYERLGIAKSTEFAISVALRFWDSLQKGILGIVPSVAGFQFLI